MSLSKLASQMNDLEDNLTLDRFDRNTFIGFDEKEINKTSTEDLLLLRRPVYAYIKSTKLKKRNANFIEVFKRINRELARRGEGFISGKSKVRKISVKDKNSINCHSPLYTPLSTSGDEIEPSLLRRKTISTDVMSLQIPSFLNDKQQKMEVDSESQNIRKLLNSDFDNAFILREIKDGYIKNNASSNRCVGSKKIFNTDEIGAKKPSFLNLSNDSDDLFDMLLNNFDHPTTNFDFRLSTKESELKSCIFNEVPEDSNFCLFENY